MRVRVRVRAGGDWGNEKEKEKEKKTKCEIRPFKKTTCTAPPGKQQKGNERAGKPRMRGRREMRASEGSETSDHPAIGSSHSIQHMRTLSLPPPSASVLCVLHRTLLDFDGGPSIFRLSSFLSRILDHHIRPAHRPSPIPPKVSAGSKQPDELAKTAATK